MAERVPLEEYLGEYILDRLYINLACKIITPYHRALNRFREVHRGSSKHGSCGVGYGECINMDIIESSTTLRYRDLVNIPKVIRILKDQKAWVLKNYPYISEFEEFVKIENQLDMILWHYQTMYVSTVSVGEESEFTILSQKDNIWEGAQGILLDENYGTNPYTTWSTTTDANIKTLYNRYKRYKLEVEVENIGVFRTFPTRHGKGPFPTESRDINLIDKISDDHNDSNDWQDRLRVGHLDMVLLKYAIEKCPIHSFILTHYDKLDMYNTVILDYNSPIEMPYVETYEDSFKLTKYLESITDHTLGTARPEELIAFLEHELGAECKMISTGQTHLDYLEQD